MVDSIKQSVDNLDDLISNTPIPDVDPERAARFLTAVKTALAEFENPPVCECGELPDERLREDMDVHGSTTGSWDESDATPLEDIRSAVKAFRGCTGVPSISPCCASPGSVMCKYCLKFIRLTNINRR